MKDLTPKQIERLAIKNRDAAQKQFKEDRDKRGVDKPKEESYTYVTRGEDPRFDDIEHRSLFNLMKKPPFSD